MEAVRFEVHARQFGIADFLALRIVLLIQPRMHAQAGLGLRGTDQVDDRRQVFQRAALPGAGDVAEQAVFDLVPLARARRAA